MFYDLETVFVSSSKALKGKASTRWFCLPRRPAWQLHKVTRSQETPGSPLHLLQLMALILVSGEAAGTLSMVLYHLVIKGEGTGGHNEYAY